VDFDGLEGLYESRDRIKFFCSVQIYYVLLCYIIGLALGEGVDVVELEICC
jgi:hypothetical protein